MNQTGTLYIVATPIGNPDDITIRAVNILRSVDAVICEETREGSTLLKRLGIEGKPLITLNEHNEQEEAMNIVVRLANGESFALISDCGTPVFADPGHKLIAEVAVSGMTVTPVPGASSLMAALSVLDFAPTSFVFGGFLPREGEQRRKELMRLRAMRMTVILMDTPYRLGALLDDVAKMFGAGQVVTVAYNLTLPGENIFRGGVKEIRKTVGTRKGEFILIVHGPDYRPVM